MVIVPRRLWRPLLLALLTWLPLAGAAQQPAQEAFIELSASDNEVYVQQQLRLTVKLYYTNQVVQGQLGDPEHPDAVIEKLGEQRQYREQHDGERYRVVEREYLIFPQKPGRFQLPPLDFQGTARHPQGHHYRIADSAVLFAVKVKDIPAGFSGRTWLPATNVSLSARGLERTGAVAAGDNLTRTLTLTARGLPATTLPALDLQYPEAIRSYPEPEQRQTSAGTDGVVGQLQQTTALVPVPGKDGTITLPEVRIPWWDVSEDREKVAVLPARTIQLTPSSSEGQSEQTQPVNETSDDGSLAEPEPAAPMAPAHWIWPVLAGVLVIGWATTALAWWLQSRRPRANMTTACGSDSEKERFHQLCEHAQRLDPAFFNDLPLWLRTLTGQSCRTTDEALAILRDKRLSTAVNHWRESLFGPSGGTPPDASDMTTALKAARKAWREDASKGRGRGQALPSLYPEGLSP